MLRVLVHARSSSVSASQAAAEDDPLVSISEFFGTNPDGLEAPRARREPIVKYLWTWRYAHATMQDKY